MASEETVYAIRCFKDGERKPTYRLTKDEAHHFRQAALHMADYLTREYELSGWVGGRTKETSKPPE